MAMIIQMVGDGFEYYDDIVTSGIFPILVSIITIVAYIKFFLEPGYFRFLGFALTPLVGVISIILIILPIVLFMSGIQNCMCVIGIAIVIALCIIVSKSKRS